MIIQCPFDDSKPSDSMRSKSISFLSLLIVALFSVTPVLAASEDDEGNSAREFDLPGADMTELVGDIGGNADAAAIAASPMKQFVERWPADLVVAPIPGYSPQLGWKLAVGAGYFLESRKEDSDSAPSLLGGFGMIAENGSYAYGGGVNLHLMDDNLRVKAGAGYMDIRYEFFGIGEAANDLGVSVDVLHKGPMYFGSAPGNWWTSRWT